MFEEAKYLLQKCLEGVSELLAEEAVDDEVGGAVDDGAEPHYVVENTGVGPNIVGYVVFLKNKKVSDIGMAVISTTSTI